MHLLPFLLLVSSTTATLLIDYSPTDPISALGSPQLEGSSLGDHIAMPGTNDIYIRQGEDHDGKAALHFHREPTYRRAEVKGKGTFSAGKKYFVGYEFMLENVHQALTIFQWKDGTDSKSSPSYQNIPFSLAFSEKDPTRLSLRYEAPGQGPAWIWSSDSDFSTNTPHNIGIAWDTMSGGNSKIQLWLDGKSVVEKDGLSLWTGGVYPKWGIYRGEKGSHDSPGASNVFDSWVYRVQMSDESLDEVADASRVKGQGGS